MPKPQSRPQSAQAAEAIRLLGVLIRSARLRNGLTVAELAERAGVSRGLVHRAERGEPGTAIGAVFELAALVGVPLFAPDVATLHGHARLAEEALSLLPAAARPAARAVDDDF